MKLRNRRGFTVIELMVVIVLGVIMVNMTLKGYGMVTNRMAAGEARSVFQGMVARARAQAIESGFTTVLLANTKGDSVMLLANGRIQETVRFMDQMGVDIEADEEVVRICMTPRGFANPDCGSFESAIKMAFVRGPRNEVIEIHPMGQILW
jgi:prepilin-type N-terminal cleavage/methylation domain-containing protein